MGYFLRNKAKKEGYTSFKIGGLSVSHEHQDYEIRFKKDK